MKENVVVVAFNTDINKVAFTEKLGTRERTSAANLGVKIWRGISFDSNQINYLNPGQPAVSALRFRNTE